MKQALRKALKNIYRGPDKAYAALDFGGKGYITEDMFMQSSVMDRIQYSREDVRGFFDFINLFHNCKSGQKELIANKGINFDTFKKTFFPHLYIVDEEHDSDNERKNKADQRELKNNKEKHP